MRLLVLGLVLERADLDRESASLGRLGRPGQRGIQIRRLDHPEPAELLLGLRERPFGGEDLIALDAHDRRRGRRVQAAGEDPRALAFNCSLRASTSWYVCSIASGGSWPSTMWTDNRYCFIRLLLSARTDIVPALHSNYERPRGESALKDKNLPIREGNELEDLSRGPAHGGQGRVNDEHPSPERSRAYSLRVHTQCSLARVSVPHTLLGLLEPSPRHGYTLKATYEATFGHARPLRFGQVYATLARLQRDGLAEVVGVEAGEGPERRLYAVTPAGVAEFESWLGTPEPPTVHAPGALFAKVVLALLSGRPAGDVLDTQRTAHLGRMREITAVRGGGDAIRRLAGDYEIAHLEADLRWIEQAGARLEALRAEVTT